MTNRMTGGAIGLTILLVAITTLTGCLSTTARRPIPAPWVPEVGAEESRRPPVGEVAPVYFLSQPPTIDGDMSEWAGLVSAEPYVSVYGGGHQPADASGQFTIATDGTVLYVHADITDDVPNENPLPPAMAWRNDSIEVFFGVDAGRHRTYSATDAQIRIVPVNKNDSTAYSLSINDVDFTEHTDARVVYTESGYALEAAIGLDLLGIEQVRPGQDVRVEFQINDGDGTERDRLIHWMSEKDDPWYDPSVWGDGTVVRPEEMSNEN